MVKCSSCGKEVDKVCSACWRCETCNDGSCLDHMKRAINGTIGPHNNSEKIKKSKK